MENQLGWYTKTLRQYISNDELKVIMQKSDWKGFLEIAHTWAWIAFALALPVISDALSDRNSYLKIIAIVVSLFILGGKQLACAIIMHDASHDSIFAARKLNNFFGNWFGAYPILHNVEQYRPYHREHHIYTGLDNDPDISLTKGYPTTAISMVRKFLRDLSGATGIKGQLAVIAMHLQILQYSLGNVVKRLYLPWTKERFKTSFRNLIGPVSANLILFGILWLTGHPLLYLLWIGALLTTYTFCLRVRSMAEHSVVSDRRNPHKNTRTTYANFFEQILFAPHHVNYHAEHHLCMGAPSYNLPKMHKLLLARGFYKEGTMETNYWKIIKLGVLQRVA